MTIITLGGTDLDVSRACLGTMTFGSPAKETPSQDILNYAMKQWTGYNRPVLINEDGVSTLNLQAAVQEHVGWGSYDNGLGDYRDGFQDPPVDWKIGSNVKWVFFEQVARLTGSPAPEGWSRDRC